MLTDQIKDTMTEVSQVLDSMPDESLQKRLMYDAHSALQLAHSLICAVNSVQLARLMNGDQ